MAVDAKQPLNQPQISLHDLPVLSVVDADRFAAAHIRSISISR